MGLSALGVHHGNDGFNRHGNGIPNMNVHINSSFEFYILNKRFLFKINNYLRFLEIEEYIKYKIEQSNIIAIEIIEA